MYELGDKTKPTKDNNLPNKTKNLLRVNLQKTETKHS